MKANEQIKAINGNYKEYSLELKIMINIFSCLSKPYFYEHIFYFSE